MVIIDRKIKIIKYKIPAQFYLNLRESKLIKKIINECLLTRFWDSIYRIHLDFPFVKHKMLIFLRKFS